MASSAGPARRATLEERSDTFNYVVRRQEPRVRGIAGAKHFEELFFDDILAQEERAVAPC